MASNAYHFHYARQVAGLVIGGLAPVDQAIDADNQRNGDNNKVLQAVNN